MRSTRRPIACGLALLAALLLVACVTPPQTPPPAGAGNAGGPGPGPGDRPGDGGLDELRGGESSAVKDSVYQPIGRNSAIPARYGLYTLLLTRSANPNSARLLADLFTRSSAAGEAAMRRENLNLVMIPVRNVSAAQSLLAGARREPGPTAHRLLDGVYDYGQAALQISRVCRPERGAQVMAVCGSGTPDGPLLVTSLSPIGEQPRPGERLLVVNLSTTPPEAVPEIVATYRRQVLRQDFDNRDELDGWRLRALETLIAAARLLPGLSKAYAVTGP